ncbi:hypothetical protein N7481_004347 [Penicillium waksmanii]|uniref:uncharacterized protein n=1 Tax=Penicillium waksmanii TaxID=69791 RepID=UPI00254704B5|nr:uncharacterized protein N7481_004347 [Penicillium waksmanii]KAJ5989137.1 hypothetical protein N7481_004347 [Penicillium waksmanii]
MYKDGLDSPAILSPSSAQSITSKHLFNTDQQHLLISFQEQEQIINMQFSKITSSAVLFALYTMDIAIPSPNPLEASMNDLEARTGMLTTRAGWTCAFGGDKTCQVKVCR